MFILQTILIFSIIGLFIIIVRKIPILKTLPISDKIDYISGRQKISWLSIIKKRAKNFYSFLRNLNLKQYLSKRYFKVKSEQKSKFSEDFWKKIRNR